jgi:hypothetical protein
VAENACQGYKLESDEETKFYNMDTLTLPTFDAPDGGCGVARLPLSAIFLFPLLKLENSLNFVC